MGATEHLGFPWDWTHQLTFEKIHLEAQFEPGLLLFVTKRVIGFPFNPKPEYPDKTSILVIDKANDSQWRCLVSGRNELHLVWAIPYQGEWPPKETGDYQGPNSIYTRFIEKTVDPHTMMIWDITSRIKM